MMRNLFTVFLVLSSFSYAAQTTTGTVMVKGKPHRWQPKQAPATSLHRPEQQNSKTKMYQKHSGSYSPYMAYAPIQTLQGRGDYIDFAAFNRDDADSIATHDDEIVRIWDVQPSETIHSSFKRLQDQTNEAYAYLRTMCSILTGIPQKEQPAIWNIAAQQYNLAFQNHRFLGELLARTWCLEKYGFSYPLVIIDSAHPVDLF
jgi:hypothetical protein